MLLRPGYSTWRIASELKSAQVLRSANAFVLWHYFHHKHSLKAGEYLFDRSATAINVHDRVARGDIYVHTLVIPEGYTIFDIAQAVQDAGLGSKQEFLQLCTADITLISDIAPNAKSLEGYLFPATYEFTRTESMHDMLAAMVKQFREVAASIGLNANVQEMVIMASIIEKETAVSEERPLVASVYYNRLARNIALQADPSVIYAELLAGTYRGALHHEDLQVKSAYNTYQAAMQPASTDYYYFVSDGNGHHRFANSLEEHNRNVVKLRQVTSKR